LVKTVGAQTFNDPVIVGTTAAEFNSTTAGDITFAKTLDGAQDVTINTAGDTIFTGKVGFTAALTSLTTDFAGAGKTLVNGGLVKTVDAQTFNDPVIVGTTAAEFNSTTVGDITFAKTLDSAQAVTVNTAGNTAFNGQVRVAHLETGSSGTATFNVASVTTTSRSSMVFGNDVVVTVPSFTFDSTDGGALPDGASITFRKSLSSSNVGQREIIIRAGDLGVVTFLGPVGKDGREVVSRLSSLMVIAAGGINIGGGYVDTTGTQTYSSPVTLSASSTLLASEIIWPSVTATVPNVNLTLKSPGAQSLTDMSITGNLTVITGMNSTDGGVSQLNGKALHVDGTSTFIAHTTVGQSATLKNVNNEFGGTVSFIPDLDNGGTWLAAAIVSKSSLKIGATKVTGDLSLKATGGEITQAGSIEVAGKTEIIATSGGVTLADQMNKFVGIVNAETAGGLKLSTSEPLTMGQVKTGGDNEINAMGKIDLGTGAYGGKLKVNSNGSEIIQSGAINFDGNTDFDAGNAKIELFNPRNLWKGSIVYKGGIVMINHPQLMNAVSAGTLVVRVETSVVQPAKISAPLGAASSSPKIVSTTAAGGEGAVSIAVARPASSTQTGLISVAVSSEVAAPGRSFSFSIESHVPAAASAEVKVTQVDGKPLPTWLRFEPATKTFVATTVPPGAFPLQLKVGIGGVETLMVINEKPPGQ
jgi:hypothetical protein